MIANVTLFAVAALIGVTPLAWVILYPPGGLTAVSECGDDHVLGIGQCLDQEGLAFQGRVRLGVMVSEDETDAAFHDGIKVALNPQKRESP